VILGIKESNVEKLLSQLTWDDIRILDRDELEDLHSKVKARVLDMMARREIYDTLGNDTRSLSSKIYFMQKMSGSISGHIKKINKKRHEELFEKSTKSKKIKNLTKKIEELNVAIKKLKIENESLKIKSIENN